MKEYAADQKALKEEEFKKMAAAQNAQPTTPVIPKPEKVTKEKVVAAPAPEVKTSAPTPLQPLEPATIPEKPAKIEKATPEEMAKAVAAEAPPPPPIEAPEPKIVKAVPEPSQAVKIEPSKAIEISKVESRKVEKPVMPKVEPEKMAMVETKPDVKKMEEAAKVVKAPEPKVGAPKIDAPKTTSDLNQRELNRISKAPKVKSDVYQPSLAMKSDEGAVKVSGKPESSPKMWNNAVQKKQRDELDRLKTENQRLNTALKTQITTPVKPNVAAKSSAEVEKLNAQINNLQSELAKAKTSSDPVDTKMATELAKLKSENEQLRLAMKSQKIEKPAPVAKVTPEPVKQAAADPSVMKQLDNLKSENQRLSSALQGQEDKMASFDAKSPEAERELAEMRKQVAALKAENAKLEVESRKTRGQVDTAVVNVGNEALTKIREYENKYEAAQADNLALSKELKNCAACKKTKCSLLWQVIGI